MHKFVICTLLLASTCFAMPQNQWYPAELIKVIDGDTIKLRLELYNKLYKDVNVRLALVDAPESRRGVKQGKPVPECELELGKQAKEFVKQELSGITQIWVKQINGIKSKYAGRMVAEVWYHKNDQDINLSQQLIEAGMAVPYKGGPRYIWDCENNTDKLSRLTLPQSEFPPLMQVSF